MNGLRVRRRLTSVCGVVISLCQAVASAQVGPAKVSVTEIVERNDIASGQAFVGTVVARRHSVIGSAVSGRVVEFLVNEGDRVEKGQPLAKLLTRNFDIQIAAATAEWELRKQELLELKNGAREEEVRQAEARMKAAEAAARYAKTKLARTKGLVEQKATTRDQIDEDTALSEVTADTYLAAKAGYDLVMAGTRPEKIAQAVARALAAEEEVNRLKDILEKHTITAPFAGYVVAEHTEVGQWIESGKLVAEVVEVDPIEIRVPVPESYIPRLTLGVSARIDVEALPNQTFVGSVTAIVPKADEKSRTFPVRITLKNSLQPDGAPLLKPGMFAKVELPVDQKKRVLLAPKDSLVLGGPQPVVYAVTTDEKTKQTTVRLVPVQLGIAADSWIEVKGDLNAGQQVVVEGNERLRPGAEIVAIPAAVKPPSAEKPPSGKRAERPKLAF
ncbi:MAG TPA: efflux RND transporter periplasmic adaptor subunit [Planctomycetaceae bacterium]|nr:efflux RND transporter periplasmic adaptor subunit [Planctomycetaceae bacterium]